MESSQSFGNSLEALDARLQDLKDDVFDTVRGHFDQFSAAFSCVNALQDKVKSVEAHLGELAQQEGTSSLATASREGAAHVHTLRSRLGGFEGVLATLKGLAELHTLFVGFDAHLDGGRFEDSCTSLERMTALLGGLPDDGSADSRVMIAVRSQFRKLGSRLKSRVLEMFASAVVLDGLELRVQRQLPGVYDHVHYDKPTSLGVVISSLQRLGLLEARFDDFAAQLQQAIIKPVASGQYRPVVSEDKRHFRLRCVPAEEVPSAAPAVTAAAAAPTAAAPPAAPSSRSAKRIPVPGAGESAVPAPVAVTGSPQHALGVAVSDMDTVLSFLQRALFSDATSAHLAQPLFDRVWWGRRDEAVTTGDVSAFLACADTPDCGIVHTTVALMQASLPDNFKALPDFVPVFQAARDFEARVLTTCGVSRGTTGVVASFVDDVSNRFAYKRRQSILASARQLCAAEYHNSSRVKDFALEVGADAVEDASAAVTSSGGSPHVSDNAVAVMRLTQDTLVEACSLPPSCSMVLYHTARDIVDVFRAIVPTLFGGTIATVPRLAMLFHNDCLYVAHRLVAICHEVRKGLPPPLNHTASMVDLIPSYRSMAEETFVNQLLKQRKELLVLSSPVQIEEIVDDEKFKEMELGIKRQMYQLSQLSSQWFTVLHTQVYRVAMGHLLHVILEDLLHKLKKKRISEGMSHHLRYFFGMVFEGTRYFSSKVGPLTSLVSEYVPSWEKAHRVRDVLSRGDVNHVTLAMILDG